MVTAWTGNWSAGTFELFVPDFLALFIYKRRMFMSLYNFLFYSFLFVCCLFFCFVLWLCWVMGNLCWFYSYRWKACPRVQGRKVKRFVERTRSVSKPLTLNDLSQLLCVWLWAGFGSLLLYNIQPSFWSAYDTCVAALNMRVWSVNQSNESTTILPLADRQRLWRSSEAKL